MIILVVSQLIMFLSTFDFSAIPPCCLPVTLPTLLFAAQPPAMSFLPEGAIEKINAACLDFTSKFSAYMLLGYFEVSINAAKLKAEEKSLNDDPEQLLTLPEPDWTIKSGWLTKEGGNYHSWKKRFFVARNQKDSFVVE